MPASSLKDSDRTPHFFETRKDFRRWLAGHHASDTELWVGFYKVSSQKKGMPLADAVEEALCVGWIDGLMNPIDAESYKIRFTPRKRGSNWSNVNIARVEKLKAQGLMKKAGLAAYEARSEVRSGVYTFEQDRSDDSFPPELEMTFRKNRKAWTFFQAQPAGYRHRLTWWVKLAKQQATRERRLTKLIEACANERRLDAL